MKSYAVFKFRDFSFYLIARLFFLFGLQMQIVIVSWQVYKYTKDPLALGLIGLSEVIPFLITSLIGGMAADKYDRKKLIIFATSGYLFCVLFLLLMSFDFQTVYNQYGVLPVYGVIFLTGICRGFLSPAQNAFMSQLVPKEFYMYSASWNSVIWDIAAVGGPAAGGLIYGFTQSDSIPYICVFSISAVEVFFFSLMHKKPMPVRTDYAEPLKQKLFAGVRFVWSNQIMLSALTLDMFAVLFGGAIALLPAFADKILHCGPEGLGFLRASPSIGAIIMALITSIYPVRKHAGKKMLWSVAGFGLCMISFALSENYFLSFGILMLSGMFDFVSVVVRHTTLQLYTPDDMRGRVSAVNGIFIGTSNELGAFESGLAARLLRLQLSVVLGGLVTLGVVGVTAVKAPKLRELELE